MKSKSCVSATQLGDPVSVEIEGLSVSGFHRRGALSLEGGG